MTRKRQIGQYYTVGNPFSVEPFRDWAKSAKLPNKEILEPFAGSNSLINMLELMGYCRRSVSYDLEPRDNKVRKRDTLKQFPRNHEICITNPPWLAKNSATVRNLHFPNCKYDDLYKFALEKCLDNCGYIAALVPESFITADLFQDRLKDFISLTFDMFTETNHPVGLALFVPDSACDVNIWSGNNKVGSLSLLKKLKQVYLLNSMRLINQVYLLNLMTQMVMLD